VCDRANRSAALDVGPLEKPSQGLATNRAGTVQPGCTAYSTKLAWASQVSGKTEFAAKLAVPAQRVVLTPRPWPSYSSIRAVGAERAEPMLNTSITNLVR
jgi:hypothetical protein